MRLPILFILVVAMVLSACSNEPTCSRGGNMTAPSAGCLVVDQGEVLLVKIMEGLTDLPVAQSIDANQHNARQSERPTKRPASSRMPESWQRDLIMVSISTGVSQFQGVRSTLPDR